MISPSVLVAGTVVLAVVWSTTAAPLPPFTTSQAVLVALGLGNLRNDATVSFGSGILRFASQNYSTVNCYKLQIF
jgi:hypothetical protein